MEKNMLVLFGSPRKNGFTKQLLDQFLQQWQSLYPSTNITFYNAYEEAIAPCTACGYCQYKAGCSNKDYIRFDQLYQNADILVVASPVYGLSFPAPLKAVFDRTQQYYEAHFTRHERHPITKPKVAFLISAYGSNDKRGIEIMKQQLELIFSVMHTKLLGSISIGNTDKKSLETVDEQETIAQLLLANKRYL